MMPKLLIFAPCERVIVDDIGKQVSMVSVLESLTVAFGVPEDAVVPLPWMVLAFWRREEGEEDKEFEERVQLVLPNKEIYAEDRVKFKMIKPNHRVRHSFFGIRVGMAGDNFIRLSVRPADNESEWQDVAEFPILVLHNVVEASTSEVASEESRTENAEV
jgi:hypothetical protein